MAERFKAAVLKTVERKLRGFESLSLRHKIIVLSSWYSVRSSEKQKIKRKQILSFELRTLNCALKLNGEVAERLKAAAC
jgi:hypothetical protein